MAVPALSSFNDSTCSNHHPVSLPQPKEACLSSVLSGPSFLNGTRVLVNFTHGSSVGANSRFKTLALHARSPNFGEVHRTLRGLKRTI